MEEDLRKEIQLYKEFMEKMAINIIPLTSKVGLISAVPIPYNIEPQVFMKTCAIALKKASTLNLEYILLDMSNMSGVRAVQNIPAFKLVIEAFRLIGIEVIMAGISPGVAMAATTSGVNLKEIRTFPKVSDALSNLCHL